MLSRSLRPLTARATSLATNPIRSSQFPGPFSIRTVANTTDPAPTPSPFVPAPEAIRKLPYFVSRNSLDALGVYHRNKRGGNLRLTYIKHGEGDLVALKQDIAAALQLSKDEISVNDVTGHIIIRGHRRDEVLNFLHTLGF